jgi:hypothetical protein
MLWIMSSMSSFNPEIKIFSLIILLSCLNISWFPTRMLSEIASVHYGPNWQTMVNFLIAVDDRLVNEPVPEHILLLVWTQSRSYNYLIDNCYFAFLYAPWHLLLVADSTRRWFPVLLCLSFNDIQWHSMTFNDIQWHSMTFNEIQWNFIESSFKQVPLSSSLASIVSRANPFISRDNSETP